jgi:gluconate 2-dehydrogenase gamma chain
MDLSRRDFLSAATTGVGAVWLGARVLEAARPGPSTGLRSLTAAQAEALDALTAQIIPTDDTPGAREAGVVRFIDQGLGSFAAEQRALFESGLLDLEIAARAYPGATSFAGLRPEQQVEIMQGMEAQRSQFFEAVLAATMAGMFANPEYGGNANKVGWKLIGFEDRFAWQPPFGYYDQEPAP